MLTQFRHQNFHAEKLILTIKYMYMKRPVFKSLSPTYSWFPITWTLATNVTRTSRNSKEFLAWFSSDHFYIILPQMLQSETLNLPLMYCSHIVYLWRLILFVSNLKWNSFTSRNRETHALFKLSFLHFILIYNLKATLFIFTWHFLQLNVIKMFAVQ